MAKQQYAKAWRTLLRCPHITDSQRIVYLGWTSHVHFHATQCQKLPTLDELAVELNRSMDAVKRATAQLERLGWLRREHRSTRLVGMELFQQGRCCTTEQRADKPSAQRASPSSAEGREDQEQRAFMPSFVPQSPWPDLRKLSGRPLSIRAGGEEVVGLVRATPPQRVPGSANGPAQLTRPDMDSRCDHLTPPVITC